MIKTIVRKNEYYDSVFLMNIADQIQELKGVRQLVLVMGTQTNKTLLRDLGILDPDAGKSTPNDLVIALEVESEEIIEKVLDQIKVLMSRKINKVKEDDNFISLETALNTYPEANLALISIPGEFAADVAKKAILNHLNVFLFSDNVPVADEIELKKLASKMGVIVMGPGCGTSLINNIAIGFMSAVRSGSIGIVGASGSGIQAISALIDKEGYGISQAIGTGGTDVTDAVGGITMIQGIEALDEDKDTTVIVVVSKPPGKKTFEKVLARISQCKKPVVANIFGGDIELIEKSGAISASTLEEAAIKAVGIAESGVVPTRLSLKNKSDINSYKESEIKKLTEGQQYLRGLFCGGTLCEESILIIEQFLNELYSNAPVGDCQALSDGNESFKNCLIDMGAEEFTKGRPHPVINPDLIRQRILKEGSDPEVAVILIDVILGYGAHEDPAGILAETILSVKRKAEEAGRYLCIVASVCGTDKDPQELTFQENKLKKAGVIVMPSSTQAAYLSGLIVYEKRS